ncbi:MAG: hypothetical protein OXI94_02340 [Gemmatimonadota bacterium]|nr:hypothetical protein [Candidatus Poribacteria bacterium]MDE2797486.1 hypothetical protein [Gemmatimonadota bacterium]
MVRFLKWFLPISMAILIVLVASAYWYVTPQRLKAIVQPHLSSALGREVMFDRIEWGLSDGVVFSDLRVEGRAGAGPFLVAERAQVPVSPGAWVLGDRWWGELVLEDAVISPGGQGRIKFVFHRLEIDIYPQNGRLYLSQIEGQACEGTLTGDMVWDNGAWDGTVSLANAQAEQVVRSIGWDIPLYGAVDITIQVSGADVSGSASMAEGRIVQWAFLQRLLHPMAQWGLIATDEVPLKDVMVVFQVQGDEVILDGTKFTASDIACTLNGKTLGGQLDYVLDVEMPIQFAGFRLGRAIPIRVKITGSANAPQVTVELK